MRRWRARGAWLPRLVRRWRPDGNPLRRTSDRIEAILLAILIAAFLCGAPLAGIAAGRAAAAGGVRAEHGQAGAHRVAAALLQQAPGKPHPMFQAPLDPLVTAQWKAQTGHCAPVRSMPRRVPPRAARSWCGLTARDS